MSYISCTVVRPCLYGLGYKRQPSPRVTLGELTFHYNLCKILPTVYTIPPELSRVGSISAALSDPVCVPEQRLEIEPMSRGARQLGWASCFVLAGSNLRSGGFFFCCFDDTLARLPGTTHGVSRVTYFRNFRF